MAGVHWGNPVREGSDLLGVPALDGCGRYVEEFGMFFIFYRSEMAWLPFVGLEGRAKGNFPDPIYLPLYALARCAMSEEEIQECREAENSPESYVEDLGS